MARPSWKSTESGTTSDVGAEADTRRAYDALIARWLVQGRRLPRADAPLSTSVAELVAEFWKHAEGRYRRPDGSTTDELANHRYSLRPLVELYGPTPSVAFGPRALRAVREQMLTAGWARPTINSQVNRVRHVFRWGAGRELVPASVWQSLAAVEALAAGRCGAKAAIPPWAPNRLRHACATRYCSEVGIEAASLILGQPDSKTTLVYTETNEHKAADLAGRLG